MENVFSKARTWVEVDPNAILHNHEQVKSLLPRGTRIMAVVKADAYGHGAVEVAGMLADRVDCFGVASAWEAVELRKNGIENDLLILGGTDESLFPLLVELDIMPSIFDYPSAKALSHAAGERKAGFFLAVDTGMTRIGVPDDEEGVTLAKRIAALPNLAIRGVFSHYARADEHNKTSAGEQRERFLAFTDRLKAEGIDYGYRSMSNSAGIMEMNTPLDMVREGIVLYGVYPSDEVDRSRLGLRPALSLRTRVELVKTVPAGFGVSYGHTFVTDRETRIATLCAGYADGVPRLLSGKGSVLIRGKRAPILGRVCMDQMMVDVTDIPDAAAGDAATVIGRDGKSEISVEEVAAHAGTIPYEVLCGFARPRLPRLYE